MRYLILTPNVFGHDGISSLTRDVAEAISSFGGDVEIWSLSDGAGGGGSLDELGIRVRGAGGSKVRAAMSSFARMPRGCRGLTVIVMHAHLAPLSLPLHWRGARVFQMLLGIEVWKPLTSIQARAVRACERLLSISAHTWARFESVNPGFARATVCHLGVRDRACDDALGDDGFALIVGRMAACERYKGHDTVIETWREVADEVPGAKLVVVGDGDDRERLIDKTHELGLSSAVRFAGQIPDDELDRLYRRCAFFVMPSRDEGFGLVFLEAMRASKACIGGLGAASEIIEDGTTGFVLDPMDHDALRRRLVELFAQPERRADMGARGRQRFERHFTSERFRDRLRDALEIY